MQKVFRETIEEIEIDAGRGGQCPLEIQVMFGIAQPEERCKERLRSESRRDPPDDLGQQQAISERGRCSPCCSSAATGMTIGVSWRTGYGRPREIREIHETHCVADRFVCSLRASATPKIGATRAHGWLNRLQPRNPAAIAGAARIAEKAANQLSAAAQMIARTSNRE